jgi:hypothetical protein
VNCFGLALSLGLMVYSTVNLRFPEAILAAMSCVTVMWAMIASAELGEPVVRPRPSTQPEREVLL